MADTTTVSVVTNSAGQVVAEEVTFSDTKNHSMTIIGLPNARYNLDTLGNPSDVTVSPATVVYNNTTNTYQNLEVITFTDTNGNTVTLAGVVGTMYDLTLLPYLAAVVGALDMFATMQFGTDYENVKNDFLQRAGLI